MTAKSFRECYAEVLAKAEAEAKDPMRQLQKLDDARPGRDEQRDAVTDACEAIAKARAAQSGKSWESEFADIVLGNRVLAKALAA